MGGGSCSVRVLILVGGGCGLERVLILVGGGCGVDRVLILVGGSCGLERVLILVGGGCGLERVLVGGGCCSGVHLAGDPMHRTKSADFFWLFCTLLLLLGVFELLFWLLAGFFVGLLVATLFLVSTRGCFIFAGWFSVSTRDSSSALHTVASSPITRILAVYSSPLHRTDGMAGSSRCLRCKMLMHLSTSNCTR